VLAAGVGSRLKPLTDTTPKCLVDICGRPILEIWLRQLLANGIDEVLINTHHHASLVETFLDKLRVSSKFESLRIVTSNEQVLLGSAGTLVQNLDFVGDDDNVFVCNADTLTDFPVSKLIQVHENSGLAATIGYFVSEAPSEVGILELDERGVLVNFFEKPQVPRGNLANAGVYVFSTAALCKLSTSRPLDIAYDLLPALLGRAQGHSLAGYVLQDVGSPATLELARAIWAQKLC
jgi:mannose-1-phosphate guanylyltransferase